VAASADGNQILAGTACITTQVGTATVQCSCEGQLFTSTTGGLRGEFGGMVELQYVGNDTFHVVWATGPITMR
jgi:hypothetical protein